MKLILERFPNASKSVRALNPPSLPPEANKTISRATCECRRGLRMNRTEAEFALILEVMKRKGEILRYEYEGITLRWADMKYTPDFLVFVDEWSHEDRPRYFIKLIEVKGVHIWDRDIVRYKGARAYWPEFTFEMHQRTKQGWKRIY